ncbi:MAG: murein biosynthesis integral membrane protein MurJ [Candidatus Komeilibacteria bacterium RIFOXYC1_FULL_37_11]|uniref:Probable lipid II flippase MurJ n=1 Tax=Candidatus Komeilibacteria bacterium RIFOXYC1_FULL_37_11 TaxID=1798555 RepID=A0A1G2BYN9_9BACT|nr:MAG: murein biosynthesis integral membrane protein MurJ [Candidatus Komeilibacteria bacterium RIFOXYC1_FULL_37_11]OGY95546.1 MAG: murein biosynthesis integral membrane protein MurJ [Candidatus Komeilibacteria bacterium RIFOXYD1_FULL_37_29]
MWQNIWHKINNSVAGGALIITFFSLLAKIFALLRERLIAHNFAAGQLSDIYYSAFRLPDLIFNTLVLGALTSAFIPVFQRVWLKDKDDGLKLSNSVLNLFLIFITILIVIFFIFTPQLMPMITPGFEAWQIEQVIILTRVMLLSVLFFVASNLIGGILNSFKRFFSFSLAASFYNIGIIIGIIFFYPRVGLIGLAYGVLLGALMHLLVQLPEVYKNGWHYKFILKFDDNLRKILKLMLPRTIGLAAGQINLVIITMIASTLTVGSISVFNYANNIQSLPVSLFAVSLAVAVFPTFTQAVNEKNSKLFSQNFSSSLRKILFMLIPISVLIVVLRAQIVRVILGTGAFNWDNTYQTAQSLGIFAISIFAQGLIPLLGRSFYAYEDTKTPMIISIISIIINIILSWQFSDSLGVFGLALAFSISSIINMLLLYIFLHFKVRDIGDSLIVNSILKISFNSILAGAVAYGVLQILAEVVDMQTFLGIFIQGGLAGLVGLLSYLLLGIVFRLDELNIVKVMLKKFVLLFKNGRN